MTHPNQPLFWRDSRMPHVELRKVDDGRKVCYAPRSHTQWSLGAITAGESTFHYRDDRYNISLGGLVLMNPERDLLDKQTEVVEYLSALMQALAGQPAEPIPNAPASLRELAVYLNDHAVDEISLDILGAEFKRPARSGG